MARATCHFSHCGDAMAARVKLDDIVEAMEMLQHGWRAFLNRETGEIVTLTDDGQILVDDEDFDEDRLDGEPFVVLPSSFDIDEWSLMEKFALEQNDRQRDELLDAIRGRGAFRFFKSSVKRLGIEQPWYRYRDAALERIAREWLEDNAIPFEGRERLPPDN